MGRWAPAVGGSGGGGRSVNQREGRVDRERRHSYNDGNRHRSYQETGRHTRMGAGLQTEKEEKGETEKIGQ